MTISNLYELTASKIVELIASRQTSPLEIATSFMQRTRSVDPIVHAWTSIDDEYIYKQAKQLTGLVEQNRISRLMGVPIGIKDVFNTEFYSTQKGSPLWHNYKAGNDARCVSYLRNEGAIIFGKTDTAELAVHANGVAKNPHNEFHVTGSSSGGSAVAVATAMVPVALGTQTGGSTIRPASWCGVYAMKPSFGLIPRTGVLKTTDTLDHVGFFSRSSDDLALMLDVLRIRGDNFPIQERKLNEYSSSVKKKWKIAFCKSPFFDDTKAYVLDALSRFMGECLLLDKVDIVEIDLPKITTSFQKLHRRIYHPCLLYYLASELKQNPVAISKTLNEIFEDAKTLAPQDYAVALREESALAQEIEDFFLLNQIDALVVNSSNGSAPHGGEPSLHKDLNALWTMCWLPVINVPKFKDENNLPFGIQLVGPRYSDYRLFKLLSYLEANGVISPMSEIAQPLVVRTEESLSEC